MILRPRPPTRRVSLIPVYYALGALLLAFLVQRLSRTANGLTDLVPQPIAVTVLSTIASGMIAFTGVVFSLVLPAVQFLALALDEKRRVSERRIRSTLVCGNIRFDQ